MVILKNVSMLFKKKSRNTYPPLFGTLSAAALKCGGRGIFCFAVNIEGAACNAVKQCLILGRKILKIAAGVKKIKRHQLYLCSTSAIKRSFLCP